MTRLPQPAPAPAPHRTASLPGASALAALALGLAAATSAGCATLERSAREDPMKCERDPKCDSKRTRTQDCSTQCNDDPACMDRCEEAQSTTKLGH